MPVFIPVFFAITDPGTVPGTVPGTGKVLHKCVCVNYNFLSKAIFNDFQHLFIEPLIHAGHSVRPYWDQDRNKDTASLCSHKYMRNDIFPAISVNKDVTVIRDCSPQKQAGEPRGTQQGEDNLPSATIRLQPLPESSGSENTGNWLDSRGANGRNDFREHRRPHPPTYREVLSPLIWFSLVNNNLLMFRLPALCCKTCIYNLALPLTSSEQFSQGYLRCCLPGLKF